MKETINFLKQLTWPQLVGLASVFIIGIGIMRTQFKTKK